MKKLILTLIAILIVSIAIAQPLKSANRGEIRKSVDSLVSDVKIARDTTISMQMDINQFRQLLYTIDQNIDSKKISKDLLEFIQKSAQMVQPKDKPKEK